MKYYYTGEYERTMAASQCSIDNIKEEKYDIIIKQIQEGEFKLEHFNSSLDFILKPKYKKIVPRYSVDRSCYSNKNRKRPYPYYSYESYTSSTYSDYPNHVNNSSTRIVQEPIIWTESTLELKEINVLITSNHNNNYPFKCKNFFNPPAHSLNLSETKGELDQDTGYFVLTDDNEEEYVFMWHLDQWMDKQEATFKKNKNKAVIKLLKELDYKALLLDKKRTEENIRELKNDVKYMTSMLRQIFTRKEDALELIGQLEEMHNIKRELINDSITPGGMEEPEGQQNIKRKKLNPNEGEGLMR